MTKIETRNAEKPADAGSPRPSLSYRALQWRISPRETLKRIRRYSFFVMFMKGALPIAALALGVAVVIYVIQPRELNRMALTFERMGRVENDLAMVNPRLTGTDDDGLPFVVSAATAVQEGRGSDRVRLEEVTADISLKEGALPSVQNSGVRKNLRRLLEHDPEKWKPVFGQDHAQTKRLENDPITLIGSFSRTTGRKPPAIPYGRGG